MTSGAMRNVAVLDDYHGVALKMADWSVLAPECRVEVFRDHLSDLDALAARLRDFEIVTCMRERTPFGRDLLERLPNLRLLVTTGMRNAAIDVKAAQESIGGIKALLDITALGSSSQRPHRPRRDSVSTSDPMRSGRGCQSPSARSVRR